MKTAERYKKMPVKTLPVVKPLNLKSISSASKVLRAVNVDESYLKKLADKFIFTSFLVEHIDNRAANILKQEMLNMGAEAAVSKDVSSFLHGSSSVILGGTNKHYRRLVEKISVQPYGLAKLAQDLRAYVMQNKRTFFTCCGKQVRLDDAPVIAGIVNVTPDSFYDRSAHADHDTAIKHAMRLSEEGASIIDIGGESSRPGSSSVEADEEMRRILPVISFCAKKNILVSVDTRKSMVAKAALDAGACIINDISALTGSPGMAELVRSYDAGIILMHMQGTPRNMQKAPSYEDVIEELTCFFKQRTSGAVSAGILPDHIIIDPGIGFGKTLNHNMMILKNINAFDVLGFPVMLGISRKSLIEKQMNQYTGELVPPERRLPGSLSLQVSAFQKGIRIFRVHDVYETRQALMMALAMEN
ncbi:MAG: dihydropteroate synthase [bacterium]